MAGRLSRWYAQQISAHSKLVIVAVLALTAVVAAGTALGGAGEQEPHQASAAAPVSFDLSHGALPRFPLPASSDPGLRQMLGRAGEPIQCRN